MRNFTTAALALSLGLLFFYAGTASAGTGIAEAAWLRTMNGDVECVVAPDFSNGYPAVPDKYVITMLEGSPTTTNGLIFRLPESNETTEPWYDSPGTYQFPPSPDADNGRLAACGVSGFLTAIATDGTHTNLAGNGMLDRSGSGGAFGCADLGFIETLVEAVQPGRGFAHSFVWKDGEQNYNPMTSPKPSCSARHDPSWAEMIYIDDTVRTSTGHFPYYVHLSDRAGGGETIWEYASSVALNDTVLVLPTNNGTQPTEVKNGEAFYAPPGYTFGFANGKQIRGTDVEKHIVGGFEPAGVWAVSFDWQDDVNTREVPAGATVIDPEWYCLTGPRCP